MSAAADGAGGREDDGHEVDDVLDADRYSLDANMDTSPVLPDSMPGKRTRASPEGTSEHQVSSGGDDATDIPAAGAMPPRTRWWHWTLHRLKLFLTHAFAALSAH
jgi:hypothetical protein